MKKLFRVLLLFSFLSLALYFSSNFLFLKDKFISPHVPKITETKIALIADVHDDWENFDKAIEVAKREETEFIIFLGDFTSVGEEEKLVRGKSVLDESEFEYYVIPGNHDIWVTRRSDYDVFEKVFGPRYQTFFKNSIKYILIDNSDEVDGMTERQMEWLKNESKDCLTTACIAFAHEPLNHPNLGNIMGEESKEVAEQAETLKNIFRENNINYLFAGHVHWSSMYDLDGFNTTIVGAVTRERNFQDPRMMVITIKSSDNGSIEDIERKEIIFTND